MASSGKKVGEKEVDVLVRAFSMGQLHHAMMGTAAIAIATSSSIPGTIINRIINEREEIKGRGGVKKNAIVFGHPSGTLRVGAEVEEKEGGREGEKKEWVVTKAVMSRSARVLMEGWVRVTDVTINN